MGFSYYGIMLKLKTVKISHILEVVQTWLLLSRPRCQCEHF